MRKQFKIAAIVSAAALLAIGASMTSFAATGWQEEDGSWVYYNKNGEQVWDISGGSLNTYRIFTLINTTDKVYMENTAVLDIIFEQVDAFLSGQKTAEEVARLVQGKMMIYVNEQR